MARRGARRTAHRLGLRVYTQAVVSALVGLAAVAPAALAAGPLAHATEIGSAPASQMIQLALPLKADDAGLERLALAVTTKGSPQYGQYESIAQLARRFGATPAARKRVIDYLRSEGATDVKVDATGLFADATMSAGTAQRLFGTPLARFAVAHGARFVAPTGVARVPAPIGGLVTGVVGLDTRPLFASPKPLLGTSWRRSTARAAQASPQMSGYSPRTGTASGCAGARATPGFTPNQYLNAYGYSPLRLAGLEGQGERVALIEIDGFRYSDVHSFARCFGLRLPAINGFGVRLSKALAPGGESTLDLEVLDASAPGLTAIDVYESKPSAADWLSSLTAPLQSAGVKPQVISASLGVCELALADAVGQSGINAVEASLALAAASGISFLASSGDSGSSGCDSQGSAPLDGLAVSYPASSSWVTGVGGTNIALNAGNQILAQPVWNDAPVQLGAGGGGLSLLFSRPAYQKSVVKPNLRAVPDVSMLADVAPGYAIFCSAKGDCINAANSKPWVSVGGTSAATPLLAGGFALVDQDLRRHGRQDLGLTNPLLYALGESTLASKVLFYDVTQGNDDLGPFLPGSNGQPLGCCTAAAGYDEASGWGSVDLSSLAKLAIELEPKIPDVGLSLPRHQRPVSRHHLLATVSCTGRCLLASYARAAIGRARPFEVRSSFYLLWAKGKKTIVLKFSSSELGKLRSGLAAHKRIVVTLYGEIVDAGGNIERRTRGQRLMIKG